MRIRADENIDRPIVAWLREQGHVVVEAAAAAPEAADADLIAMSQREDRILITFDRDIGRLVQSDTARYPGVVYLRIRGAGPQLWDAFQRIWPRIENGIARRTIDVFRMTTRVHSRGRRGIRRTGRGGGSMAVPALRRRHPAHRPRHRAVADPEVVVGLSTKGMAHSSC